MKKELVIESKGSIIGLIIKTIVFSIIAIRILNRFFPPKISVFAVIPVFLYFLYRYFVDKTIVKVNEENFDIIIIKAFPKKEEVFSYKIENISAVKLVQSSSFLYGKKSIIIYDKNGDNDEIYVNLRYYQLVQLEKFLNEELHIKADLIG